MGFFEAISSGFKKYADFNGRSIRSEYWFWSLFVFLGSLIAAILDALTTGFVLGLVFTIGTFLPSLAVSVRRLHDTNRTGWWILLGAIPIIGSIILLIWFATKGTAGANAYGPDPTGEPTRPCPRCGVENHISDLQCVDCGFNFSQGTPSEGVESRRVTRVRFLIPAVGFVAGLLFSLALLQVTKASADEIIETFGDGYGFTPERVERLREDLDSGLQLVSFWPFSSEKESLATRRPVRSLVWSRLPLTLELFILGGALALLLAWGNGLALRHPSPAVRVISTAIGSIPIFWLGLLMILLASIRLGWLPAGTAVSFTEDPVRHFVHLVMPLLALGVIVGSWAGLEMRGRPESPPMLLVRSLGLVMRHGGMLLSSIILVEFLFSLPGLGRLLLEASYNSDFFVIGAAAALFVWLALLSRLVGNLLLAWIDTNVQARITEQEGRESGSTLVIGGIVTIGLLVLLFLVGYAAPDDPLLAGVRDRLIAPGGDYLLGTDAVGRDILSRILVACRTAAVIALLITLVALLVGIPLTILRISLDRARNSIIPYWIEGVLEGGVAVPWLVIGILIQAKLGFSWPLMAMAVILVPRALRVGWALGAGERLEFLKVANLIIRQGALFLAAATLISATLGFVGLGVQPPTPDFGVMMLESRTYIARASWLIVYPGIVLTAIVATWLVVAALLSRSGLQHRSVQWSHIMS